MNALKGVEISDSDMEQLSNAYYNADDAFYNDFDDSLPIGLNCLVSSFQNSAHSLLFETIEGAIPGDLRVSPSTLDISNIVTYILCYLEFPSIDPAELDNYSISTAMLNETIPAYQIQHTLPYQDSDDDDIPEITMTFLTNDLIPMLNTGKELLSVSGDIVYIPSLDTLQFSCAEVTNVIGNLEILQDTLYFIDQGSSLAHIPFSICNANPYADPMDYYYRITSTGHIGSAIDQRGTFENIYGGECEDVYGVIEAGETDVCDFDTLTIVVWGVLESATCVQIVHVIEPLPVSLFTTPVLVILVIAVILVVTILMRRRIASSV